MAGTGGRGKDRWHIGDGHGDGDDSQGRLLWRAKEAVGASGDGVEGGRGWWGQLASRWNDTEAAGVRAKAVAGDGGEARGDRVRRE